MNTYNPETDRLLKELNSLTGLQSVKQSIQEIVDLETVNQLRKNEGLTFKKQTLHMLFTGNPGTGKTTVARLVGKIFYSLGILKKDTFKEVGRNDLVGQYVGHTADKTDKVVKSALDGVLFIDEAYALSRGSRNDYGNEAIDTIVPLMENYRDRLIVILAGYSGEMEDFMRANSGLDSRIAYKIEFPDYTGEELFQIFLDMCKSDGKSDGWICSKKAEEKVRKTLIAIYKNRNENFGNGRDVRNFLEEMVRQQAKRVVRDGLSTRQELITFSTEDIPDISEPSFNNDGQTDFSSDFNESNEPPQDISNNPPTPDRPLLLGILADVSLSMVKSINNRDDIVQNRFEGFRSSLHKVIDRAKDICKEKSSDNIKPLMKVFVLGFGFGNPLSFILGDDCTKKVRDLFELSNSSQTVIPINKLIDEWENYESHIDKLIRNMCGETPMGEAFEIAEERLLSEFQNNAYYENPILFILSDGVPTDATSEEVIEIAKRLKSFGTIIISCYVTDKNVARPKYLYNKPDKTWDEGAKLLFDCASIPPKNSAFYGYFNELEWETNENSGRLFAQINETQFLEDFLQSVISPLKNFK